MRGVERREREIRTASTRKYPDARGHRYRVIFSTGAHSQTFGTGSFITLWRNSSSTGSWHDPVLMSAPLALGRTTTRCH